MAKKAELEDDYKKYHSKMKKVRDAENRGMFRGAVNEAFDAFQYIDGMMQYGHRFKNEEFRSIPAIDTVLKYAPLLLDYSTLGKLETMLQTQKRIEKNTSLTMADKLATANTLMREAHRLWNHIDHEPNVQQDQLRMTLGGSQDRWRSIAEGWEKMGLLNRSPDRGSYILSLTTRMGQIVSGKCPSCGDVTEAPKAVFLEELDCSSCGRTVLFVLQAPSSGAVGEE